MREGDVARASGGVTLRYKWPNDVLLNGAKASGLLLETASAANGMIGWVVIGVGINVAHYPEDMPYPATSLQAQGARATVESVLPRFVGHLADWYDRWRDHGFAPVRDAWLEKAAGLAEEVEVRLSNETIRGRFERLDADGALIIALPGGETRRITSGDVFFDAPGRRCRKHQYAVRHPRWDDMARRVADLDQRYPHRR